MSRNSDRDNQTGASRPIERISVLGAGTMGHGIAQVAAAAGYDVVMRDIDDAAVQRGLQSIVRNLSKGVQVGKVTEAEREQALQRIR
ncbi:MAG TPA: 3-hydroxyacyl-CoA dehydrogenase NAD-binding domain-containing protein, partial [Pyrinomonadaceae bacterium]|nr:3-hydroxyacyl-CoA dehydrogenase NAD-binding domain-containing protein [Pyrinomonadaceae bacterium]